MNSNNITIVGAGMAGLLAGCMLRSDCSLITEAQDAIPNNHSALLRFRSSVVGDVIGVPFQRVSVLKTSAPWRNPLADALAYSFKCNGSYTLRSSLSAQSKMEDRYIAPPDFIEQMRKRIQADILLGVKMKYSYSRTDFPIISTIPMPSLMDALGYEGERPTFRYVHGCNINAIVKNCDAYGTVYVPNPDIDFNRISLTGDKLTIEFANKSTEEISANIGRHLTQALSMLGMGGTYINDKITEYKLTEQKYAKILPCDENLRKRFILWATEHRNVYSLGRFATWRPGLLLDDVVNDVRIIQSIISHGTYNHRKAT